MGFMDKFKEAAKEAKDMYDQAKADGTLDEAVAQAKATAKVVAAEVKNQLKPKK